jgi:hypothetical protein
MSFYKSFSVSSLLTANDGEWSVSYVLPACVRLIALNNALPKDFVKMRFLFGSYEEVSDGVNSQRELRIYRR